MSKKIGVTRSSQNSRKKMSIARAYRGALNTVPEKHAKDCARETHLSLLPRRIKYRAREINHTKMERQDGNYQDIY